MYCPHKQRLGVQINEGVLVCKGQLQGQYPVYLPDRHLYTTKTSGRRPPTHLARGSKPYHGENSRKRLGSEAQTHGEESHKGMLWLPKISR